jgi:hypothetical protein
MFSSFSPLMALNAIFNFMCRNFPHYVQTGPYSGSLLLITTSFRK